MRNHGRSLCLLISVVAGCALSANASTFDSIYAFGDSLSDAGNVYAAVGIPPSPPYYNGEFSNGPIWIQDLANGLGLPPLTPSLAGGTDYAYGGGETAPESFNTSDVRTDFLGPTGQLAQYELTHSSADPNALYTIWFGSNDLADLAASTSNPALLSAGIGTIVQNIDTGISDLAALGAKHFLVLTVPDLGLTPLAASEGASAELSALSAAFDATLVNGFGPLPSLANLATADSISLNVADTYSLLDKIAANPAAYGFTNTTDSCLNGVNVCANPNQYLFWDNQHPTAAGHALIADAALAAETPEPMSIVLIVSGLAAIILLRRSAGTRS